MKIAFNLINCGLGNNGGSLTIIKSANTLVDLGHEVYIIDSMPNMCTWEELRAEHININLPHTSFDICGLPVHDVVIATGFKTIKQLGLFSEKTTKYHWIRGWELWNYSEKELAYLCNRCIPVIVSGIQLQEKLKWYCVGSTIIRPGYDLDDFKPIQLIPNPAETKDYIKLGGIYNQGKKRKTKRVDWIYQTKHELEKRGHKVVLWMFGTDEMKEEHRMFTDYYLKNPDMEKKNWFYNNIDIWLAPTELEGLHMPPAEAMLTECPVVGTNAELSGMEDYLINYETGLVSDNTLKSFINCTEYLVKDSEWRQQLGKAARKKVKALGDRKENMQKMVEIMREVIDE